MSMGSQALERSALESKDRDSLLQIATAMGGKPGSRAKKADIVELILQLAGVPAEGAESSDATGGAESGDAPASESGGARRSARGRDEQVDDAGSDTAAAATDDDASSQAGSPRSGERGARGRGRGGDGGSGQGDRPRHDDRPAGGGNGNSTTSANSNLNEHDDDNDHKGRSDQGDGDGQGDGEGGNRRRRRRGRDRGRDGVPTAGAGSDEQFQGEPVEVIGLLDLRDEGYGFLRVSGFLPSKEDVYVSVKQVRQFGLRKGDQLKGAARAASRNEKNPALLRIDEINDKDPEESRQRIRFEDLTAIFPTERLELVGSEAASATAQIIEAVAPIGKGQRGLIAAPPKTGKTTVLRELAEAVEANNPDVHLLVLLIDERPEEVTELRRAINGEIIASTFDRPADEHTMVAELTLERAKRLVEDGEDVVIILDGLTRLARAYNLAAPGTGRVMAGGIDTGALYPPKRFFGAARNVEDGGSLTIIATAVVDSGSRLDEVVHETFEGTANMELRLDRRLADRRMFPAIDVTLSSTRHDERLFDDETRAEQAELRRMLSEKAAEGGPAAALELLLERVSQA